MSYAQDTGYLPITFDVLMATVRESYNAQFGTSYTEGTFIGTNAYKFYYAPVQKILENETKTAEVFAKLQEYLATTNGRIQRPSTSLPGIIDSFKARGYTASVAKPTSGTAGSVYICIDVDVSAPDYPTKKLEIATFLKDFIAAGMVFQGTQTQAIVLSNGQSFDFKFYPPTKTPITLRLTVTLSDNQDIVVPNDQQIRQMVLNNLNSRYRLGWDFEPQRYFTQADAPWAATVKLEYSFNGGTTWLSTVYQAAFTDLFTYSLAGIAVVVAAP